MEAYVLGRPEPVIVAEVQTRRDDFAWTLLVGPGDAAESRIVYVPEHGLERVEVCYRRRKGPAAPIGFRLGELKSTSGGDE